MKASSPRSPTVGTSVIGVPRKSSLPLKSPAMQASRSSIHGGGPEPSTSSTSAPAKLTSARAQPADVVIAWRHRTSRQVTTCLPAWPCGCCRAGAAVHQERWHRNGRRRRPDQQQVALAPARRQTSALGEVLELFEEARATCPNAVAAVRLLILTGCRSAEILGLRWEDVDLERRCLHLPDSKTGQRTMLLNVSALAILEELDPQEVVRG